MARHPRTVDRSLAAAKAVSEAAQARLRAASQDRLDALLLRTAAVRMKCINDPELLPEHRQKLLLSLQASLARRLLTHGTNWMGRYQEYLMSIFRSPATVVLTISAAVWLWFAVSSTFIGLPLRYRIELPLARSNDPSFRLVYDKGDRIGMLRVIPEGVVVRGWIPAVGYVEALVTRNALIGRQ